MTDQTRACFDESVRTLQAACDQLARPITQAADVIIAALRDGRRVFTFGNGGSAADAQHIAGELVGRFTTERRPLAAEALTTDTAALTSIANDYGFEAVFARQLAGKGSAGDVALAISTSGNSPNVVAALKKAREMGMATIAMTGRGGGKCADLADVLLDVPAEATPRIQEAHAVIYHALCALIDAAFLGE